MHTATADHILHRMTEVQKIEIYQANEGQLEYIRQTLDNRGYGPVPVEVMAEIKSKIIAKSTTYDASLTMVPSTWKW